jgi:NADPH2:quinone reductase
MKALLCRAYGPPESLVVEEVATPVPGPGEVLVDVKAAGVNFPDTLIIQNKYQIKPPLPFSPGGELAGTVRAVGEGVKRVRVGQPVIGFTGWGAFAQCVTVPQERIIPMPEGMPFDVAGSFVMTYGTCLHALKDRAQLARGETVLVLGAAGGIGLASVELAKALGAGTVIAAASSDDKLATCRAHGADATINYRTEDLREKLKTLVGGKGVDVVCDPVGGAYAEPALRSTGWRGRYLVLGFADGEIPKLPLNLPLLKGSAIVGVFYGEFVRREPANAARALGELMAMYQQGAIKPLVYRRYTLAETADALNAIARREVQGKAVVIP